MSNFIFHDNDGQNKTGPGAPEQDRELEQALSRALRRVEAPEGFAARMRALAEADERTARVTGTPTARHWWSFNWKPVWGTAAALVVAGVLTGHAVHERRVEAVQQEHVRASQQFDVSVEITDKALEHAREQMRRAGVSPDEQ